jgi:molybdopterin-binding protein
MEFSKEDKIQELMKSQELIESGIAGHRIFEIGNMPHDKHNTFISEYIGGFIHADKGIMKIGVCVKSKGRLPYNENKKIAVAYAHNNEFFLAEAKIESIHEADEKDLEELNVLFQNRMQGLVRVLGAVKFIVANIIILSEPKKQNRRQHLRISAGWNVFFKIINPDGEMQQAQKKWLDEKIFETSHGYFKTTTDDISAGGYRSIIKVQIPEGTEIDCVIEIIGKDNMKAVGQLKAKVLSCDENQTRSNAYDMRVKFMDMSDSTIDIVKKSIEKHT